MTGSTHNNVVIELADSLLVIDAPLYTERADTLLSKISETWPNKPIEALILSHFHWDHTGGTRSFVAAGIPIVVGEALIPFFEEVLARPRTLFPDALSESGASPVFQPFSAFQETVYTDGNGEPVVRRGECRPGQF